MTLTVLYLEQAVCAAQVMEKYNVVFQYLLRLKRIQVELEGAWGVMRR